MYIVKTGPQTNKHDKLQFSFKPTPLVWGIAASAARELPDRPVPHLAPAVLTRESYDDVNKEENYDLAGIKINLYNVICYSY